MTVVLVILAILLTIAYLGAGGFKLASSKQKLRSMPSMAWTEDYSATQIKVIAALEVLGALGVILPLITGVAPVITAIAALCLVLVQAVAIRVHVRRGERQQLPVNVVLLVLALLVAMLRYATL